MDELSRHAEFVSFCPEHFSFGSLRPSNRMVRREDGLKIISNKTGEDLTSIFLTTSQDDLQKIGAVSICGIVFKSKSPTCGLMSSKVYLDNGFSDAKDNGIFANLCRENFVMQVFAYESFEQFKKSATMKELVLFHQNSKFMLQSKDEALYRQLGKIVGNHENKEFQTILDEYELGFKTAIAKKAVLVKLVMCLNI